MQFMQNCCYSENSNNVMVWQQNLVGLENEKWTLLITNSQNCTDFIEQFHYIVFIIRVETMHNFNSNHVIMKKKI